MTKIIQYGVTLPARAERLFDMYLDPGAHGAITGGSVTISAKEGTAFQVRNGTITGMTIAVVPKKYIVQLWRSNEWKPEDRDSILVLSFLPEGEYGTIELTHLNVPEKFLDHVSKGWNEFYWKPWLNYLKKEQEQLEQRAA